MQGSYEEEKGLPDSLGCVQLWPGMEQLRAVSCVEVAAMNFHAVTCSPIPGALCVSPGHAGAADFTRSIPYVIEQMITLQMRVVA